MVLRLVIIPTKGMSFFDLYFYSLFLSFNLFTIRLIELYVKHKRPVDVGRIVYLMKNDGLKPDQELTKYTLFQGYIETGDPAVFFHFIYS